MRASPVGTMSSNAITSEMLSAGSVALQVDPQHPVVVAVGHQEVALVGQHRELHARRDEAGRDRRRGP
jgi:hypothetical protein